MSVLNNLKKEYSIKVIFDQDIPQESSNLKILSVSDLPPEKVTIEDGTEQVIIPKLVNYITYSKINYEHLVDLLIREKYSISNELALIRQKDIKIDEYNEYFSFVENCKTKAKQFINERDLERKNDDE